MFESLRDVEFTELRGFPNLSVILIRTKKHNNGLCKRVSHLGALFNYHVQNNELNGKHFDELVSPQL